MVGGLCAATIHRVPVAQMETHGILSQHQIHRQRRGIARRFALRHSSRVMAAVDMSMIALIEPGMIAVIEPFQKAQNDFKQPFQTSVFHLLFGMIFYLFFDNYQVVILIPNVGNGSFFLPGRFCRRHAGADR